MSRAAIFVLPARYEPFGLAVLEAALAGCALVLGDIPSLREIWQDAALFAPTCEPDAIAAALAMLITDAPLRQHMGQRARSRALEFSPRRTARAYLALYHEMSMSQKSPAPERDRSATRAESCPQP
jgi:glycosyltransferase involved in cell wall biosynthesis